MSSDDGSPNDDKGLFDDNDSHPKESPCVPRYPAPELVKDLGDGQFVGPAHTPVWLPRDAFVQARA